MTGLKDICDIYGMSKSTALRRVKECFGHAPKRANMVHLDSEQMQVFADYLAKRDDSKPVHTEPNDASVMRQLELENARLSERCANLTHQVMQLESEVERLHAALEREQRNNVGFWSRLGRKLLGDGTHD